MNRRFSFNQERYNIGSSYNAFDQMLINHPETSSPGSFPKMNMNHQMNMMSIFPQPIIEERREIKFENYKFTDKPPTLPTVFIDGKFVDVNDIVQQIVYNRPPAPHIPNNEMLTNVCPLSFCPITCPSRGVFCLHSQCFDLRSFLLLQSDENWLCPICRTPITWNSLRYDPAFFLRIFRQKRENGIQEIQNNNDQINELNMNQQEYQHYQQYQQQEQQQYNPNSNMTQFQTVRNDDSFEEDLFGEFQ